MQRRIKTKSNIRFYTSALFLLTSIFIFAFGSLLAEKKFPYPRAGSNLTDRVINRRYVSHLLLESVEKTNYLTMMVTHPGPWAFHANSYPLRYSCGEYLQCVHDMKKLNDFLLAGNNLRIKINGERILSIEYLTP